MGLSIIDDEKSLNMEMLDLFIEAVEGYGIKVNETVEDEVEVDEKSFIE